MVDLQKIRSELLEILRKNKKKIAKNVSKVKKAIIKF